MTRSPSCPRIPGVLLGFCLPGLAGASLLGDLEEEFVQVASRRGLSSARSWYWSQTLRSLWPALTLHVDRRGGARLAAGVFLGAAILWVIGDLAMTAAIAGVRAAWPSGMAPPSLLELAYMVGLLPAAVLAGYAAVWQAGTSGSLAGVSLAGLVALPAIVAAVIGTWSPPLWSHLLWFVLGPSAVVFGASRRTGRYGVS